MTVQIYDPVLDEMREATQVDIDNLYHIVKMYGMVREIFRKIAAPGQKVEEQEKYIKLLFYADYPKE